MLVKSILAPVAILSGSLLHLTQADPIPNTPPEADIGSQQTFTWTPDTTGEWTDCTIILKSGSNLAMTVVTTVVSEIDCSTIGTYTWTVPDVTPTSAIYFLEFDAPGQNATWTTRFAIASTTDTTVAPANAKQPDGEAIPWGTGKLVDAATNSTTTSTTGTSVVANTTSSSSTTTSSSQSSLTNVVVVSVTPSSTTDSSSTPDLTPTSTIINSSATKIYSFGLTLIVGMMVYLLL